MRNFVIGALALGLATISSKPALSESVKQLTGEVCRLSGSIVDYGSVKVIADNGILKIFKSEGVDKLYIAFYNDKNKRIHSYSEEGDKKGKVCDFNLEKLPKLEKVLVNGTWIYPFR